jgi:hypothetical protein
MCAIQDARLKKLPGLVKCRYEDVKSFHESVVRNRQPEQFATPKLGGIHLSLSGILCARHNMQSHDSKEHICQARQPGSM